MSFMMAAVYKNAEAWIVADTQTTDMKTGSTETKSKIVELSDTAAISFSGSFEIAQAIANAYKKKFSDAWTTERCIKELKETALIYSRAYTTRWNRIADCTFIQSSLAQGTPSIYLLTLAGEKVQVFQEPIRSGQYCFYFANPIDLDFDQCLKLCQTKFLLAGNTQRQEVLSDLVQAVASQSKYVGGQPTLWHAYTGLPTVTFQ